MIYFEYIIKEPAGIHARPASVLVKAARTYVSTITIDRNGQTADVKRLMSLMALGVKCGETVKFTIVGEDEEKVKEEFETLCKVNL